MVWNPELYDQFKKERSAPFFDLLKLVIPKDNIQVIDLGCGTGELTSELPGYLSGSEITGIDSSAEMLEKAKHFETGQLKFYQRSIEEQLEANETFDLIISNAAIQWCDHHEKLFPEIISRINKGGQLAIQIPSNHEFIVHQLLRKVAETEPYKAAYHSWTRQYSVLKIEDYARIMFDHNGSGITVFEKVYPLVMDDAEAVFTWASGTAMIPYLDKLPEDLQQAFNEDYKKELKHIFTKSPVFYPFKRTFISATF
ncbi:methyltransferase domain-containing protein [Chryseobacterium gregarium]|uniref:methyltransferase domain-containing protein n=1 Tax=Chryseobacterium gregarium TaxID=456299 RepID=UPI00040E510D|nr:methyltransferase domain-containing protein [Chryseobacterium gregarium]